MSSLSLNGLIESCLKLAGKQFQETVYRLLLMGCVGVFLALGYNVISIIKNYLLVASDCTWSNVRHKDAIITALSPISGK